MFVLLGALLYIQQPYYFPSFFSLLTPHATLVISGCRFTSGLYSE